MIREKMHVDPAQFVDGKHTFIDHEEEREKEKHDEYGWKKIFYRKVDYFFLFFIHRHNAPTHLIWTWPKKWRQSR